MRKNIIVGNWKMNLDRAQAITLVNQVISQLDSKIVPEVVFAPPYVHLYKIAKICADIDKVTIASQNCSAIDKGAYTGEVSASMIASCNAQYVIIGHSERRINFHESNEELQQKVNRLLANDLEVIFCCGESLQQREEGSHFKFIEQQITDSLLDLSAADFQNVTIAYEPIWAIGTGVTATTNQAQEMHSFIRHLLTKRYSNVIANTTSILYGGSCNPSNSSLL